MGVRCKIKKNNKILIPYIMHPALRKGPLFLQNTPPFSTFVYKKTPPFHFLPTGLSSAILDCIVWVVLGLASRESGWAQFWKIDPCPAPGSFSPPAAESRLVGYTFCYCFVYFIFILTIPVRPIISKSSPNFQCWKNYGCR